MLAWFGILALGYIVARAFGYIGGLVAMTTAKAVVFAVKVTAFTAKCLAVGIALPLIVVIEGQVNNNRHRRLCPAPFRIIIR